MYFPVVFPGIFRFTLFTAADSSRIEGKLVHGGDLMGLTEGKPLVRKQRAPDGRICLDFRTLRSSQICESVLGTSRGKAYLGGDEPHRRRIPIHASPPQHRRRRQQRANVRFNPIPGQVGAHMEGNQCTVATFGAYKGTLLVRRQGGALTEGFEQTFVRGTLRSPQICESISGTSLGKAYFPDSPGAFAIYVPDLGQWILPESREN